MFRYVHPSFQIKHLLQVEMLEQLRDYPKNYLKLIFSGYGNGIVRGCGISWNNNKLTIEPGIIYYNHNLYMMNERYLLECWPENEKRYLKIEFMEEIQEPNQTVGMGRIKLSRDKADPSCELELCRFILQEGARLRNRYENFEDYSTEYDTINLIHVPYAAKGESSLQPGILKQFAKEALQKERNNPYDISFSMNILALDGSISRSCIKEYLHARGLQLKNTENQTLYEGLLHILKANDGNWSREGEHERGRSILMI